MNDFGNTKKSRMQKKSFTRKQGKNTSEKKKSRIFSGEKTYFLDNFASKTDFYFFLKNILTSYEKNFINFTPFFLFLSFLLTNTPNLR